MSINIANHTFEGPYSSATSLKNQGGVYAILTTNNSGNYSLLDVGESGQGRDRVQTHDRADCWQRNKHSGIYYAVLYTPGMSVEGRRQIEKTIRDQYDPPCGKT